MGTMNTGGYDQALSQRLLENSTPVSSLYERIRQLEKQCASLAAEVDRMRPVTEAAWRVSRDWGSRRVLMNYSDDNPPLATDDIHLEELWVTVTAYEASNPK